MLRVIWVPHGKASLEAMRSRKLEMCFAVSFKYVLFFNKDIQKTVSSQRTDSAACSIQLRVTFLQVSAKMCRYCLQSKANNRRLSACASSSANKAAQKVREKQLVQKPLSRKVKRKR